MAPQPKKKVLCPICPAELGQTFESDSGLGLHLTKEHLEDIRILNESSHFQQETKPMTEAEMKKLASLIVDDISRQVTAAQDGIKSVDKKIDSISELIKPIGTDLKSIGNMVAEGQTEAAQTHPAGLCQDPKCETCVQQGQLIATAAYNKGISDEHGRMSQSLDEALLLAGGADLQQQVLQLIKKGTDIKAEQERAKQPLSIAR